MKKTLALFILTILCLPLVASGCAARVASVAFRNNAFADTYTVDETVNYDAAFLTVTYSDGSAKDVNITPEMVTGFDTATTGKKTLTVTYEGTALTHEYYVYNAENAQRPVVLTDRVFLDRAENESGTRIYLYYKKTSEFSPLAISFTLEADKDLFEKDKEDLLSVRTPDDSTAVFKAVSNKKIRVIINRVNAGSLPAYSEILCVKLPSGIAANEILVKEITLSDGKQDYYLPAVRYGFGG